MKLRFLLCTSALCAVVPLSVAHAQDTQSDESSVTVQEIVVTAQKRTENLQDVPVTINALAAEQLERSGVQSLRDLNVAVPGLTMTGHFGGAFPFVRGVGQSQGNGNIESPVAMYVDGLYIFNQMGGVLSFNDIARVEVLKGPQGTLFGRNATGGVIQIITKDPPAEAAFEGDIGYASYRTIEGRFYAGGALSSNLRASLALFGKKRNEGFGRNLYLGREAFLEKSGAAHAKLVYETPDKKTRVTLNGFVDYTDNSSGEAGIFPGFIGGDGVTRFADRYTVFNRIPSKTIADQRLGSVKIEHDLGWGQASSITGYHHLTSRTELTQNGIPGVNRNPVTGVIRPAVVFRSDQPGETWTQELQLQAPDGNDFQWVGGLFFLRNISGANSVVSSNDVVSSTSDGNQQTRSVAFFAQGTKTILADTRLTLGIRYTRDKIAVEGVTSLAPTTPAAAGLPPSFTNDAFTYRIALDRKFGEDVLAYASYNTGFKSGRYVLNNFANPPVKPEKIKAYEIGLKTTLFDQRLRFNIAAFAYDFTNLQVRAPNLAFQSQTLNAASARGRGVDVDFDAAVTRNFDLGGGFEYFKGTYNKFPSGPCPTYNPVSGAINGAVFCDLSGADMIRAPRFSAVVRGAYTLQSSRGDVTISASNSYSGSYKFEADGRLVQPAFHKFSAAVAWTSPNGAWGVKLWGTNLFDEFIMASGVTGTSLIYIPGEPRTVGVTFKFKN